MITGVFDHVLQSSSFPYVTIGEIFANEFDTQTYTGLDCICTIHAWSRYAGRLEVLNIQRRIFDILHRNDLAISDGMCFNVMQQTSDVLLDPDGETRHGIQTYRIMTAR